MWSHYWVISIGNFKCKLNGTWNETCVVWSICLWDYDEIQREQYFSNGRLPVIKRNEYLGEGFLVSRRWEHSRFVSIKTGKFFENGFHFSVYTCHIRTKTHLAGEDKSLTLWHVDGDSCLYSHLARWYGGEQRSRAENRGLIIIPTLWTRQVRRSEITFWTVHWFCEQEKFKKEPYNYVDPWILSIFSLWLGSGFDGQRCCERFRMRRSVSFHKAQFDGLNFHSHGYLSKSVFDVPCATLSPNSELWWWSGFDRGVSIKHNSSGHRHRPSIGNTLCQWFHVPKRERTFF